jgi:dihydropteroate synthase
MGIVNVTPDSFSGDGYVDAPRAIARALLQAEEGCDIIDIGGESTRPGHVPVAEPTEMTRVVPVIRAVRAALPTAILSVDSFKPEVARTACEAGANLINSVWGLPEAVLEVALEFNAPVVIMHNQREARYGEDVVDDVLAFLDEAATRAVRHGLPPEHVLLDPGIGFGKTQDHNLAILSSLPRIVRLGFPTLLGTSRKSFIGRLTGREPQDRAFGTAATTALAIAAGIDVVRVHDVRQTRDVVAVADAIVRNWRPERWTE